MHSPPSLARQPCNCKPHTQSQTSAPGVLGTSGMRMRGSARLGEIVRYSYDSAEIFAYSTDSEGAADSARRPLYSIGWRAEKKKHPFCASTLAAVCKIVLSSSRNEVEASCCCCPLIAVAVVPVAHFLVAPSNAMPCSLRVVFGVCPLLARRVLYMEICICNDSSPAQNPIGWDTRSTSSSTPQTSRENEKLIYQTFP
jgi:hypothetical protein